MPAPSVETTIDAVPVASSVAVSIVVAPSLKETEPVGTPVAGATGRTVAVSVTACPTVEGLGDAVRVVVVAGTVVVALFPRSTVGALRASVLAVNSGRLANPNRPATRLLGKCWMETLYDVAVAF